MIIFQEWHYLFYRKIYFLLEINVVQVAEVFLTAGHAFQKLGDLTLQLHAANDTDERYSFFCKFWLYQKRAKPKIMQ